MNDRSCFLHVWIFMSVLMAARCRPTLKGMHHKTKKLLRPIQTVIPKPLHERSKKHNIFTLAAPPTTAALLPAVSNMVLMPNNVPAAMDEPMHHMFHQHPLDIPYGIPGTLHRGSLYSGLHQPIPWHYYAGLYRHHGYPDPYRYHGPALYPVDFPAGYPSYVDHHLGYNSADTVFLGARSTLPHRSVPALVNYPKSVVHYPHPHYVQLNGNGQVVIAPPVHVYS